MSVSRSSQQGSRKPSKQRLSGWQPGPGYYDEDESRCIGGNDASLFSFGQLQRALHRQEGSTGPSVGPGCYSPEVSPHTARGKPPSRCATPFGATAKRGDTTKLDVVDPGPGSYPLATQAMSMAATQLQLARPGFGFGTARRFDVVRSPVDEDDEEVARVNRRPRPDEDALEAAAAVERSRILCSPNPRGGASPPRLPASSGQQRSATPLSHTPLQSARRGGAADKFRTGGRSWTPSSAIPRC
eukprot:TRINITY_DN26675_c0_g1_i5.p2 TRINITY_DN26675_c0_g1~~TRINITY_DN26675_c0_g1_i5.p2  ORF type:complete len:243 (+),score=47.71 TRINITY_DN26675_c0_g1_i5:468-1196(+)